MASNYPDDGRARDDGGDASARLPFRPGSANNPDPPWDGSQSPQTPSAPPCGSRRQAEARAELRDRETYYTELRLAVHCQNRSVPRQRAGLDGAAGTRDGAAGTRDGAAARCGDTWT